MYRRPSKKRLLIQHVLVYAAMTVAVVVIVTGVILFLLGYRLDSSNGRLEQGTLLQFESEPAGAVIAIDGQPINVRTPGKASVLAGEHTISMSKAGYHDWSKKVNLAAGTLVWLDYARLIPQSLTAETVLSYSTLAATKASPDLKMMLVQPDATVATMQLVDLRADEVKISTLAIPAGLYNTAPGTFAIERWDDGSRYALIKHSYAAGHEWLLIDTQDMARSRNVSTLFNVAIENARFDGTSGTSLFGLVSGAVHKLDLAAGTVSQPLITSVTSFETRYESDVITFEGVASDGQRTVGLYRDGDQNTYILRSAAATTDLHIAMTRFLNDDYVAITEGAKVTILKGHYPTSSTGDSSSLGSLTEFTFVADVQKLSFSPSGDYVVVQSDSHFASYDVDNQVLTLDQSVESPAATPVTLRWLDDANLWSDAGDTLTLREFDGSNLHTINAVASGFDATLSQNGRFLYSFTKTDTGYALQRVKLIID